MASKFEMDWSDVADSRKGPEYLKVESGKIGARIRLIGKPALLEVHWEEVQGKRRRVICSGADCPLCRAGSRITKRYQLLVLDRTNFDEDDGYGNGGPEIKLYDAPASVVRVIADYAGDKDYGEPINYDIKIRKEGSGIDTKYHVVPGRITPLTAEEQEVVDAAPTLTEINTIPTAEEIKRIGFDILSSVAPSSEDDDTPASAPASREAGSESKEDEWGF